MIFYLGLITIISYLCGSLPTAYIAGKLIKGIDIRQHGSGNVGATNVFRVLGTKWGIFVLVVDIVKGGLAVYIAQIIWLSTFPLASSVWLGSGVIAFLGHLFPVWLHFKGGKGVAVATGMFLVLKPLELGSAILFFLIVLFIGRYVSLASMLSGLFLTIMVYLNLLAQPMSLLQPFLIVTPMIAILIIVMHRKNMKRLINGEENKIFVPKEK